MQSVGNDSCQVDNNGPQLDELSVVCCSGRAPRTLKGMDPCSPVRATRDGIAHVAYEVNDFVLGEFR
jgi:hypothetical protein